MKFIRLLLLIETLALLGCTEQKFQKEKPLKLAFITCCIEANFFEPVRKGMDDAAEMLGVSCDFIGTEGVDLEAQADMVRQVVKAGYDGIALNIIDPVAFDEVIKETIAKGIPVVGFNVDDHETSNTRFASVNQQLFKAGKTLASHLLPHIPQNEHVLMTMHDEGVSALEDRLQGLQDVLKQKNITWSILISGNESENGSQKIADFLTENPAIKIVLCTGQSDTEAAGMAIEKYFPNKNYWSAGFDLSPKTLQLVQDGFVRCTVDQQPYIQGFYPVVQLTQYLRYGIKPSDVDAGASVIDKSNVGQVLALTEQGYR